MAFFNDKYSDSSSNSDESMEIEKGVDTRRMLADELFDSDSDADEKRVVLTEKQKRFNKMKETISNLRQNIERLNFASVEQDYDTLIKDFEKSKKVIDESGIPSFFIRAIYRLEDRIKNFSSEDKKKLSQANNRAMNAISRKILKLSSNLKEELEKFTKNPTPTTDEGSGDEKTDSDFNDNESNDSIHPLESNDPMVRRNFWLLKKKKEDSGDSQSESEDEGKRRPKERKVHEFKVATVEQEREIQIDLSYEGRTNILKEFVAKRTQKHFDLKYTYQVLKAYLNNYIGHEEHQEITTEIIMILVPISVDYSKLLWNTSPNNANCMSREMWIETFKLIQELLKILKKPENLSKQYNTYSKQEDNKYYPQQNIIESVSTFFCTIIVEINKSFQCIETSSEEQYKRIQDLYDLLRLGEQIQNFYDNLGQTQTSTRIAFLRLENMYYIHDSTLAKIRESFADQQFEKGSYFHKDTNTEKIIHDLATLVYKNDEASRTKATLYHIYHHSIHDRAQIARDYLLMSKITDNVTNIDSTLQTFYNRVLVQLGLAYFRQGNFTEAFNFLNDLCSASGKIKELIGQAQLRYLSQNDKKKVLPQHQHINVEMIESVNFICSMLIEGPVMVVETHIKNITARNFRRLLDSYTKSHFISTPEQNKDYIYFATKELQKGNWKGCYDHLLSLNIWKYVTGLSNTLQNLMLRIKEQSFKSYLFQFKNTFENLSLNHLVEKFELDSQSIQSMTFKMISAQELIARVHTIENQLYIIFEHSDRTTLQVLSNKLIDSVNQSQNQNQKILDKKIGNREQTEEQNDNTKQSYQQQQKGDRVQTKKKLNIVAQKPKNYKKKY